MDQAQAEALARAKDVVDHWASESFNELILHAQDKGIPKDYELVRRKLAAATLKLKLLKGAPK